MHAAVRTLYLVSVYLHVLAAITWIGGMVFLVVVLAPLLRRADLREHAPAIFHAFGPRFRVVGWLALITLLVTGEHNVSVRRGYGLGDWLSGRVFADDWGQTLLHKLILVALILTVSLLHDFWIGPSALRLARASAEKRAERYRRAALWIGRGTFLAALAVVAYAIQLLR